MIVTRLSGGIGNQLFQYAAGRSLASRLGTALVLDSSWIRGRHGGLPGAVRRYELACFDLDARLVRAERVARLPPRTRVGFKLRPWLPSLGRPTLHVLIEEARTEPDARFFSAPDDTYLNGLWHSERYFEAHADEVRARLAFVPPLEGTNAELARRIEAAVSVALHVRRGDYVTEPETRAVAGVLDERWYRRALDVVAARAGDAEVFVFSDEPEWCRANLDLGRPATFVTGNAGPAAFEDLRLMSRCRHHVIANSTFSWWGAWLGERPGSVVVAPEPWRLDGSGGYVVPERWHRLERAGAAAASGGGAA